jgi:hypothetical protein
VGQRGLINGGGCDPASEAGLLFQVDSISRPLTGTARARALQVLGFSPSSRQVAQRIVLRMRQITGTDLDTTWKVSTGIQVDNYAYHEPMPVAVAGGTQTPLVGHGPATGDTVQVVLLVAGTPDELSTTQLESVQLLPGCRTDAVPVSVDSPYLGELGGGTE